MPDAEADRTASSGWEGYLVVRDATDASAIAQAATVDYALPWLDRFSTASEIIAEFERHGTAAQGLAPRGPLEIARLYLSLDRRHDALETVAGTRRCLTNRVTCRTSCRSPSDSACKKRSPTSSFRSDRDVVAAQLWIHPVPDAQPERDRFVLRLQPCRGH
jgi:hypothetical protein